MVEWWQALLISLASSATVGVVGLATAYFVNRWSRQAGLEADERSARSKAEEESRQARRELRRERIKPIRDFLEVAKGMVAAGTLERMVGEQVREVVAERLKDMFAEHETVAMREIAKLTLRESKILEGINATSTLRLAEANLAAEATASSAEVAEAVDAVWQAWEALSKELNNDTMNRMKSAIRTAEEVVESYLSDV